MKKIIRTLKKSLIFMSLLGLLPLENAYCASVNATAEKQEKGSLTFALEQDFMFERDLKSNDSVAQTIPFVAGDPVAGDLNQRGKIEYKLQNVGHTMVNVGYQALNDLSVYVKLGAIDDGSKFVANESGRWTKTAHPSIPEHYGSYKTEADNSMDNNFVGAVGVKYCKPISKSNSIGVDAQYLAYQTKYNKQTSKNVYDNSGKIISQYSSLTDVHNSGIATIREWHIAPYITKTEGKLNYYAGMKYSELLLKTNEDNLRLKSKDNVGVFAGLNIPISKLFAINIEGRAIDESAVSMCGTFLFGKITKKCKEMPVETMEASPCIMTENTPLNNPVITPAEVPATTQAVDPNINANIMLSSVSEQAEVVSSSQTITDNTPEINPIAPSVVPAVAVVEEQKDEKTKIKEEKARIKAEKKAEKAKIREEKKAEKAKMKEENAKFKAENDAKKAELKAEKAKLKEEKIEQNKNEENNKSGFKKWFSFIK